MSTTNPTDVTEILTTELTTATEAVTEAITDAAAGLEGIKELMDAFDPAALLPDLGSVVGIVTTVARFAVLAAPMVLLVLGLAYLFLAPKEANYHFGYRCYFGMGSVEAWRFTQRLAGIIWAGLGIILTAVMVFITGSYGGKDVVQVVDSAVTCLIWEIVLAAVSCLAINVIVMLTFDRKGYPRKHKNKDAA